MKMIIYLVLLFTFVNVSYSQQPFWQVQPNISLDTPFFVFAFHDTIYVMNNEKMKVSTNNGNNWTEITFPTCFQTLEFFDSQYGWALNCAYQQVRLYYTTNGGLNWNPGHFFGNSIPSDLNYLNNKIISIVDRQLGFIGYGSKLWTSPDGGINFQDDMNYFWRYGGLPWLCDRNIEIVQRNWNVNSVSGFNHSSTLICGSFNDVLKGKTQDDSDCEVYLQSGVGLINYEDNIVTFFADAPQGLICIDWVGLNNAERYAWALSSNSIAKFNDGTVTYISTPDINPIWEKIDGIDELKFFAIGRNNTNDTSYIAFDRGQGCKFVIVPGRLRDIYMKSTDEGWAIGGTIGNYKLYHFTSEKLGESFEENELKTTIKQSGYWGLSVYIADPVDIVNGNYYSNIVDFNIRSNLGIKFERTYNSIDNEVFEFGHGWKLNFGANLTKKGISSPNSIIVDGNDYILITKGDGSRIYFKDIGNGNYEQQEFTGTTFKKHTFSSDSLRKDGNNYLYKSKDRIQYLFNLEGKLLKIIDRNGNETNCEYTNETLTKIIDPAQREYTISYNSLNLISQITDFDGRSYSYFYNSDTTLRAVYNPIGDSTVYEYDSAKRLNKHWDWNGNLYAHNFYSDASGSDSNKVVKQYNALGAETIFVYDTTAKITKVINVSKQDTSIYHYDEHHRIVWQKTPSGETESYDYNSTNDRNVINDMEGKEWHYEYESGGNATLEVNPKGDSLKIAYDDFGNVIQIEDSIGVRQKIEYNPDGLPKIVYDGKNSSTTFTYDSLCFPIKEVKVVSGDSIIIERKYDSYGNVISQIDPNKNTTYFSYDLMNRLDTIIMPNGIVKKFKYDPNGNKIEETDGNGNIQKFIYDANNNLIEVIEPFGKKSKYFYDSTNNLKTKMLDPKGNEYLYEYDSRGRLIKEIQPHGSVIRKEYDKIGNLTKLIDPKGNSTEYYYDDANVLTLEITSTGDSIKYYYDSRGRLIRKENCCSSVFTTYEYDGNYNTIAETNALNETKSYEYDENNKRTKTIYPSGTFETSKYDLNGNRIEFTDLHGRTTRYFYNANNKPDSTINYNGRRTWYKYDKNLNLIETLDAENNSTHFEYDSLNRLVSTIDPLGNKETTSYDLNGNIIEKFDAKGNKISFAYDSLNRQIALTDALNNKHEFRYDLNGNLDSIIYPNGRIVTGYEYDASNRLTYDPERKERYEYYEGMGLLEKTINGENIEITLEYDDAFRVITKVYRKGNLVDTIKYSYTSDGLIESITDASGTITNVYNDRNQLIESNFDGDTVRYEYSGANREKVITPNFEIDYGYTNQNILNSIDFQDKRINIQTDKNGMLKRITYPNQVITEYDYNNSYWLDSIKYSQNGKVISKDSYIYDNNGNRIEHSKIRQSEPIYLDSIINHRNSWQLTFADNYFEVGANTIILCPDMGFDAFPNIVHFAESLKAPIFFINGETMLANPEVLEKIKIIISGKQNTKAILYGNPPIISNNVVSELKNAGITEIERIFAKNRFELAVQMVKKMSNPSDTCFIVASDTPYDAAMVSTYSAKFNYPVYLSYKDKLADETKLALKPNSKIILVGSGFEQELKNNITVAGHQIIKEFNSISSTSNSLELFNFFYENRTNKPMVYLSEYQMFRENIVFSSIIKDIDAVLLTAGSIEEYPNIISRVNEIVDTVIFLQSYPISLELKNKITDAAGGLSETIVYYQYDAMDQLVKESNSKFGTKEYKYNKTFNRDTLIDNDKTIPYQYDEEEKLTAIAGLQSYEYDGTGSVNKITDSDDVDIILERDLRGRVTKLVNGNQVYEYKYDALDRRYLLIHSSDTTKIVYGDDLDPIYEVTGTDTTYYISSFGIDDIYVTIKNGESYINAKDGLGSIIGFINEEGESLHRNEYDAFGINQLGENKFSRYSFTGRETSDIPNQYYYRARNMDANAGRFLEVDPIRGTISNALSLNQYAYVRNNGMKWVDPEGKYDPTMPIGCDNQKQGMYLICLFHRGSGSEGNGVYIPGLFWITLALYYDLFGVPNKSNPYDICVTKCQDEQKEWFLSQCSRKKKWSPFTQSYYEYGEYNCPTVLMIECKSYCKNLLNHSKLNYTTSPSITNQNNSCSQGGN